MNPRAWEEWLNSVEEFGSSWTLFNTYLDQLSEELTRLADRSLWTEVPQAEPEGREAEAMQAGQKVVQVLLRQGRPKADAIRDAERWVEGNFGINICLPR